MLTGAYYQTIRDIVLDYRDRVIEALESSFREEHSSREIAVSFAIGIFITALPTLGTGLLVFVLLVYVFNWMSKIALFAAVLVLNPVVKWGVYALSFWIGTLILGPVPGVRLSELSFSAGPEIVSRLLVGNLILAVVFSVAAYFVALKLVNEFREREIELDELVPEPLAEKLDMHQ